MLSTRLVTVLLLFSNTYLLAQNSSYLYVGNEKVKVNNAQTYAARLDTTSNSIVQAKSTNIGQELEVTDFLLRFKRNINPSSSARINSKGILQEYFTRLQDHIAATTNSSTARTEEVQVVHEFKNVFGGVRLRGNALAVIELKQLDYVEEVRPVSKVQATLVESLDEIRVVEAWNQFGVSGAGVTVGI
ncbi:MAG: hypothetical protein RIF33_24640, partial [Cyclobacteriaceae bacterium]